MSVPHAVFHTTLPCLPMAVLVPPTAVTHGSLSGQSACGTVEVSLAPQPVFGSSAPQSPVEKLTSMPSIAACIRVWS